MPSRASLLASLLSELNKQINDYCAGFACQILVDSGAETTGEKRNRLIDRADGKYIVFFDDDDKALPNYISSIMKAIEQAPDVITVNGYMTTNGQNKTYWDMGLSFRYCAKIVEGKTVYERFPNHLCAMKKELIKDFKFQHITRGEDYEWAKRIHDAGVLKTEVRITEPVYHYCYNNK